jgi:aminopeptidase N
MKTWFKKSLFSGFALIFACFSLFSQKVDVYQRPLQMEPSRDYDARHYRISLTFDLEDKRFWGENRITLASLKEGLTECALDAEELTVGSVLDETGKPLAFEQTDKRIVVRLPRKYDFGEVAVFTVRYQGHDPKHGLFFDEETPAHPRLVSTVSWPDCAHHWVPCYDYPHDKVTHELIVTVSAPNKVLSNGRLMKVGENADDGTVTYYWSQDLPHSTYLFMLAIGPFAVIEDSLGNLPVNYWVYPNDREDARWIFAKTPAMIDFFNKLFNYEYPWAKYDQVVSPRMGGGAENTSATLLGEGVIHNRRAEQDFSWERVIAHEIAHQWWGDLITLRTWSETWLNESFGTYSDYLWTRFDKGEEEGAVDLRGKKEQYLREARTRYIRPIVFDRYERPQDNFDSHTYPKGACVLHMLRSLLGDGPFFAVLTHFLHKHAFQAVDTHDFRTAVKDVTGQNLDWFFEQWLFKPGHPVFEVSSEWNEEAKKLRLRIRQNQDTSADVPIYRMPVDIGIVTAEGKVKEKVWLEDREERFEFDLAGRPLLVRFDEGNHLLKEWIFRKESVELIYQLQRDDVIGRSWAAGELAGHLAAEGVKKALSQAARLDPFWDVRLSAVRSMGHLQEADEEIRALLKEKAGDENSKVRVASLQILGKLGDARLVPFFKTRFAEDDSYLAQAETLRAIGKCGGESDLDFLDEAGRTPSPRNVIERAANQARDSIRSRNKLG